MEVDKEKLYTMRWYTNKIKGHDFISSQSLTYLREMLDEILGPEPEPVEEERPGREEESKKKVVAIKKTTPLMNYSYKEPLFYKTNYKQRVIGHRKKLTGMTVHWPASRLKQIKVLESKWAFIVLDTSGVFHVPRDFDLMNWGYHTGPVHKEIMGSECNLGVEAMNPGLLQWDQKEDVLFPWYNTLVDASGDPILNHGLKQIKTLSDDYWHKEECIWSLKDSNINNGWYLPFTPEQEHSLIDMAIYLKNNYLEFSFDNVSGHDEICKPKGRKDDPGAALSMTMPEFRTLIKSCFDPGPEAA